MTKDIYQNLYDGIIHHKNMHEFPILKLLEIFYNHPDRYYHNIHHIKCVVDKVNYFDKSKDINLLLAALLHDVIYDKFDHKEVRSAQFIDYISHLIDYDDVNIEDIKTHILATKTHELTDNPLSNILIKSDLYELTNPTRVIYNTKNILLENSMLYKLDFKECANKSIIFLENFKNIMNKNKKEDFEDEFFWISVINGIQIAIDFNKAIQHNPELGVAS